MKPQEASNSLKSTGARDLSVFCIPGVVRYRKSFLLFAFLIFGALVNLYLKEGFERLEFFPSTDLYKFQLSGQRLLVGESMYWTAPAEQAVESHCSKDGQLVSRSASGKPVGPSEPSLCLHPNLNPPVFGFVALLLADLSPSGVWWIWAIASATASIVAFGLFAGILTTKPFDQIVITIISWIAFLLYYPSFAAYSLGQVTFILFLPLIAGWLALRKGQDFLAGAWIGLAASLKPFFGLFLLLFFVGRYWRAATGFIFICFLALIGGAWLAGINSYFEYMSILGDVTWLSASWNGSIAGYLDRIFKGIGGDSASHLIWLSGAIKIAIVSAVFLIGAGATVVTRNLDREVRADILFALAIPAMLLISPLGWLYYYPFLFLTFYAIAAQSMPLNHSVRYRLLIAVAIAMTAVPTPLLPGYTLSSPLEWFWDAGRYTYALLIGFGLIVFIAIRLGMSKPEVQAAA